MTKELCYCGHPMECHKKSLSWIYDKHSEKNGNITENRKVSETCCEHCACISFHEDKKE